MRSGHTLPRTCLLVLCLQVYELCLHFTNNTDHNVVNAALETLHQLLQSPPPDLVPVLLSSKGVTRSRIQAEEGQEKLALRSLSMLHGEQATLASV